ncbi:hypothetical protein [Candidatus Brachybacter algidus]|uniref:hypothetical protein n=1 Tax=Candidatus Brachybacter algidus TaxID=2982024 RepID=UPI001D549D92|nr:hypothetical protein [Candidatus Brachybacter algidus]MBK6447418.1 hypothetical protein [Candidatus Brachybacter algidus]
MSTHLPLLSRSFSMSTRRGSAIYYFAGRRTFWTHHSWSPGNAEGRFSGQSMTLYEALKESRNSVSVYLMKQMQSTSYVLDLVNNMGIDKKKIPAQPSICLGAAELTCV